MSNFPHPILFWIVSFCLLCEIFTFVDAYTRPLDPRGNRVQFDGKPFELLWRVFYTLWFSALLLWTVGVL